MLCRWEKLPPFMQTKEVWPYYQALAARRGALLAKRTFDFTLSTLMLAFLWPLFLCLAIWIRLDSPGPAFFRQERITQYGRPFRIYKFRTMVAGAPKLGASVTEKNDPRITRAGKKLRGCRLDELPQLINIWKGEMSFVGTRPEAPKYVKQYSPSMYATLLLPAGVTSEASIRYKDEDQALEREMRKGKTADEAYVETILPEKMRWNLEGIRSCSLLHDVRVMARTVRAVWR